MCISALCISIGIIGISFATGSEEESTPVALYIVYGIGRGFIGSIIANSIGMVTKKDNLVLLMGLYYFGVNLGEVGNMTTAYLSIEF